MRHGIDLVVAPAQGNIEGATKSVGRADLLIPAFILADGCLSCLLSEV